MNPFKKQPNQNPDFKIFAMFDSKVGVYEMPMFAMNEHDMLRQIQNLFDNPQDRQNNKYFLNAEDFQLFELGSYTRKNGELTVEQPKHIANLHELKSVATQKGIVST